RRRRNNRRNAWPRSFDLRQALGPGPNIPWRDRGRHARTFDPLRMVGLITALILIPLVGALALYVTRPNSPRGVGLMFKILLACYALIPWQKFDTAASRLQVV